MPRFKYCLAKLLEQVIWRHSSGRAIEVVPRIIGEKTHKRT